MTYSAVVIALFGVLTPAAFAWSVWGRRAAAPAGVAPPAAAAAAGVAPPAEEASGRRGRGRRRPRRVRDRGRVDLLVSALGTLVALVLLHQLFPWSTVPVVLWAVPALLTALAVAGAVLVWPSLPWIRRDAPRWRIVVGTLFEVVVAVVVLVVLLVL